MPIYRGSTLISGSGGSSNPWWWAPPLAAVFTPLSGDATLPTLTDDINVGLVMDTGATVAGDISRIAVMTIPSPTVDWSAEFGLSMAIRATNFSTGGIFLRNSVSGKAYDFGIIMNGSPQVTIERRPGLAGFTSTAYSQAWVNQQNFHFWKITYVAATTTYTFWASVNAKQWVAIASLSVADLFGAGNQADKIGFGYSFAIAGIERPLMTCDRFAHSW